MIRLTKFFALVLLFMSLFVLFPAQPAAGQEGSDPLDYSVGTPQIQYEGRWEQLSTAHAEGGMLTYTSDPTAALKITFQGGSVDLTYATGPEGGSFSATLYTIEGVVQDVRQVNASSPQDEYGLHLTFDGLPDSVYLLVIRNGETGTIWIDEVAVFEANRLPSEQALTPVVPEGEGTPTAPFIAPPAEIAPTLEVPSNIDQNVIEAFRIDDRVRVIINLEVAPQPGAAPQQVDLVQTSILNAMGDDFQVLHQYGTVPALAGYITEAALNSLANNPLVKSVQLDGQAEIALSQSRTWINVDDTFATYGLTGQGITVAVVDSGVDRDHPAIMDAIVGEQCYTDLQCEPGNVYNSANAEDENGHGTHVTGIVTSDDAGYLGIAPNSDIVAVRVLGNDGFGWWSDIVAGLQWIVDNQATLGVRVVNMSLGGGLYSGNCDWAVPALTDVIAQLHDLGILVAVASANQGNPTGIGLPACISHVLAVGSTLDTSDTIASYSNSNSLVDVLAPGSDITSAMMGGGSTTMSGTSMATPTIAGVAALLLEQDPTLTPEMVEAILEETGVPLLDARNGLTFPRVDVLAAADSLNDGLPNDLIANALVIDGTPYTDYQDVSTATSSGDPATGCAASINNTVWYRYTPASLQYLTLSTEGSNFDTVISVYTGTPGSLVPFGCNDDSVGTAAVFNVVFQGGTTYYLMLSGKNGANGNLLFNVTAKGVISGTVTDQDTSLPIQNAAIYASGMSAGYSACTDSNGDYSIAGLALNEAIRIYAAAGPNTCSGASDVYAWEWWQNGLYYNNATPVTLTDANSIRSDIDFTLEKGGTLSGVVTDTSAVPIANMVVEVRDGNDYVSNMCTAADGTFSIDSLPPNRNLTVSAGGFNNFCGNPTLYWLEWWQEALSQETATPIVFTNINRTANATFTLMQNLAPVMPSNLTVTGVTEDSISLAWQDNSADEDGFKIYRWASPQWVEHDTTGANVNTYTDSGLTCNTTYYYSVSAFNNINGESQATQYVAATTQPCTGAGTISGTVYDEAMNPLANVPVWAQDRNDYMYYNTFTCTDANGDYSFLNVVEDRNIVVYAGFYPSDNNSFMCGGTGGYGQEYWQEASEWMDATDIVLTTGNLIASNIDFTLPGAGTITVTTYNSDGSATQDKVVVRLREQWDRVTACTDASGAVTFYSVPYGWNVTVTAGGDIPRWLSECAGGASYSVQYSDPITLSSGNPTEAVSFNMTSGGTISGRVTNETGTGIGYAGVQWGQVRDQADQNGYYTLEGVPFDSPIRLQADSWPTYGVEFWEEAAHWNEATGIIVTVANPTRSNINFTLPNAATVSGTVYDETGTMPLANVFVMAVDHPYGYSACTDINGNYTLQGLSQNESYIISASRWDCGTPDNYIEEFWQESELESGATPVLVQPGGTTGINFTLSEGGTVSGTITDQDTVLPVPNINIQVNYEDGRYFSTCADGSGNYSIAGLPFDVPFRISVADGYNWCGGATNYLREFWQEKPDWSQADTLTLTQANPTLDIDLTPAQGGTISGQVVDQVTGQPIPNMNINLSHDIYGQGTCTDQDGNYSFVVPFDTDFRISAADGNNWCGGPTTYLREYWQEKPNWETADPISVTAAMPSLSGIDFTLEVGAVISGTFYQGDGVTPITGNGGASALDANNNFSWINGSGIANDGSYNLVVPTGSYVIQANAVGYAMEFYNDAGQLPEFSDVLAVTAGTETTGIDFILEPGGTISGTVYDETGTVPLANISINVDGAWIGTCTDANGQFTVTNAFLDHPYKLSAGGEGWCGNPDYAQEWWQETPNFENATPITLTAGAPDVTGINFTLQDTGTVSGVVTDQVTGQPLSNIWIWASYTSGGGVATCTNELGEYQLRVALDVDFKLEAQSSCDGQPPAVPYVREYYQEVDNPWAATELRATAANPDLIGINFTLEIGGTISGQVTDQLTGQPIAGMSVQFDFALWGCTDANGYYTLWGIPFEQSWYINTFSGFNPCSNSITPYAGEWWQETPFGDQADPIIIHSSNPNVTGYNFTLELGGTVSGTVVDAISGQPVANVTVDTDFFGHSMGTCTDQDGHYTLYGLPLNYDFKISAGGHTGCGNPTAYAREYWEETSDWNAAAVFNLSSGNPSLSNINFTLELGGTISGTIYQSDGVTPITSDAWANAEGMDIGYWSGTGVNPDGTYQITVAPGTYRVWSAGNGYALEYYQEAGPTGDNATQVTVGAGATVTGINFTLDPGGTISGTVYDEFGAVLPNITVDVDGVWNGTCTDVNGQYTIYNVPLDAPYTIHAGGQGWCGNADYLQEWWQDAALIENATPITLTAGTPDATGINFTLAEGGTISGTVVAAEDSAPLADIWICAFDYAAPTFDQGHEWACTQTLADGTYLITGVPAGDKRVWLFPEDRLRLFYNGSSTFEGAAAVTVTAGNTTSGIDFSLPLGTIITGMVYAEDGVTPLSGVTISTASGEYPECSQGDGSYRIWVPLGTHVIKAEAGICNSQVDFPTLYYDQAFTEGTATPITVSDYTTISGIDFIRTVGTAPTITTDPANQTIASGSTATLNVVASGAAPLSYQWYQGMSGDTSTPVGTNSDSFTTPALTAATSYWVQVSNSFGSADSQTATISIGVAPAITDEPDSQTITSGSTASLTVVATGDAPLSYQWYQGATGDTSLPVGTDSASFTTPALTATTAYWVRVSNAYGSADSATATITVETPQSCGVDTVGIYRNSDFSWYLRYSNTAGFAETIFNYGLPSDVSIIGDWDGDGYDTVGIRRDDTFYLKNDNTGGSADITFAFGAPSDIPVAGDWDGDGIDTIGVYRPDSATWFLRNSNSSGDADFAFAYGLPNETPVTGDWNGDGVDTVGIYRDSDFSWYLHNSNDAGFAEIIINFGLPSDDAVVGDWNGDCYDTVGIYRSNEGNWYLKNTNESGIADLAFAYGLPNERGVTGHWLPAVGGAPVVVEGDTPEPTEEVVAIPTETPIAEFTDEPTSEPTLERIMTAVEADNAAVTAFGTWTGYPSDAASGGSYLYSSGAAGDALVLTFDGSYAELTVVTHPSLGNLVVEVDGVVVTTANLAQEAALGVPVVVGEFPSGLHSLRVYPEAEGMVVAVDTFRVDGMVIAPVVIETPVPTETATPDPVETEVPTETVTPDPVTEEPTPTETPLPALLPVIENFDEVSDWEFTGNWQPQLDCGYAGACLFATTSLRDTVSTLTYRYPVDLTTVPLGWKVQWALSQNALLSVADSVAYEVSTDGGATWQLVAFISDVNVTWEPLELDLSAYMGQVVNLRISVNTLVALPENSVTVGYWLDEMQITAFEPLPEPTETPIPTEVVPTEETPIPTEVTPTEETPVPTAVPTETPTEVAPPTEVPTVEAIPTEEPAAEPNN